MSESELAMTSRAKDILALRDLLCDLATPETARIVATRLYARGVRPPPRQLEVPFSEFVSRCRCEGK